MRKINIKRENSTQNTNLMYSYMFPFCVLLLQFVIIFMVRSSSIFGKIKIDLPKSKTEIIIVKKEPIAIFIKKEGTIFIEKDQIRLPVLSTKLNEADIKKDTKIFVLADKEVIYEKIVDVISAIYSAGFYDVTLVTELRRL